ncbi:hypothetical protein BT69DRAFT_1345747 [Atractiella rhizophila]|nr:hypothetical protein BT69DRAFT_1345747 [Atractiella rhizophila]
MSASPAQETLAESSGKTLKRPRSEPTEDDVKDKDEAEAAPVAETNEGGYATNGDWAAVWNAHVWSLFHLPEALVVDFEFSLCTFEANAYYFWNSKTNETTWNNPMDPSASSSNTYNSTASTSGEGRHPHPLPANPMTTHEAGEIDPDLLYLDPSLSASHAASSGYAATASFNARTGRFQNDVSMNPERVSEIERMKRQNQFFFDYEGWTKLKDLEQESAQLNGLAEEKRKSKRPTRKEVERYKAKKEEKKRKHQLAWLRD